MKTIRYYMLLTALLTSLVGSAKHTFVTSATDVKNARPAAGDTLIMQSGIWKDQKITFSGTGTETKPIVLCAETAGEVLLTGSSLLTIDGSWLVVSGIRLNGIYIGKDHTITFSKSSHDCRLTESAITSYSPTDNTVDTKWISIHGQHNRVDHCWFENKTNSGTLLVVWLENGIVPEHKIDNNYFSYRNPNVDNQGKELNGQEIIRIGDSGSSMQTAACVVENNLFYHCDGEIETISNKSCGNTYRNNTFMECAGTLTLRHGNGCIVENNTFIGNDKPATGGVRIIGENHLVRDNYMESLAGNNYRAGICLVRGKQNSELNEYFQVKNAQIEGNVLVNCKEALCVNYHSSTDCTMPVIGSTIADNILYNDNEHKSYTLVNIAKSNGLDVHWTDNRAANGKYKNTDATALGISKVTETEVTVLQTALKHILSDEAVGPAWRYKTTPTWSIKSDEDQARGVTVQLGVFQLRITRNGNKTQKQLIL